MTLNLRKMQPGPFYSSTHMIVSTRIINDRLAECVEKHRKREGNLGN